MVRNPLIRVDLGILDKEEVKKTAPNSTLPKVFGSQYPIGWLAAVCIVGWVCTLVLLPA